MSRSASKSAQQTRETQAMTDYVDKSGTTELLPSQSVRPRTPSDTARPHLQSALDTIATLFVIAVSGVLLSRLIIDKPIPSGAIRTVAATKQNEPKLPDAPVPLKGAALRGNKSAPVALIVYSDYQCPYCGRFARESLPTILKKYVEPGQILLAFRNLPLTAIHPFAHKAAEAAECAGAQGKYWSMHDLLFEDQKHLSEPDLQRRADALELDRRRFDECLAGEAITQVKDDEAVAQALGITGTPTFFIGTLKAGDAVAVSRRLAGALPIQDFEKALDRVLDDSRASPR